jgi:type IV pilus assembly protein PilM
MFNLFKKRTLPIGVDLGSGFIKIAQLKLGEENSLRLHAAALQQKPEELQSGTAAWQRWACEATKKLISSKDFVGKEIVAAIPSDDMFIEQFQIPSVPDDQIHQSVLAAAAKKLPFDPNDAMLKHVVTSNKNNGHLDVLVMATEREKIDRNLAIYEKAGLNIKGIGVWPMACINSYTNFFGRREADHDIVAMLLEIGAKHTNIIICKHNELLFARVIAIGLEQINKGELSQRFLSEMEACCRYFETNSKESKIERLVFFSDRNAGRAVCDKIAQFAKLTQIPAQIGDVLAAIGIGEKGQAAIDRRGPQPNWSKAFGLSLEGIN